MLSSQQNHFTISPASRLVQQAEERKKLRKKKVLDTYIFLDKEQIVKAVTIKPKRLNYYNTRADNVINTLFNTRQNHWPPKDSWKGY